MLDYKVSDDRWKEELRKEIVTAITGSPLEKIKAFGQVGYYYKCHAPATIYKYFRDDQRSLEAVKCNKLWYSAPCKFNDVFDCDILIDEKERPNKKDYTFGKNVVYYNYWDKKTENANTR